MQLEQVPGQTLLLARGLGPSPLDRPPGEVREATVEVEVAAEEGLVESEMVVVGEEASWEWGAGLGSQQEEAGGQLPQGLVPQRVPAQRATVSLMTPQTTELLPVQAPPAGALAL